MTDQGFAIVRKGYDPIQVNEAFAGLSSAVKRLEHQLAVANEAQATAAARVADQQRMLDELSARSTSLQKELAAAQEELAETPELGSADFEHLGTRVVQILELAKEEAEERRSTAAEEADRRVAEARSHASRLVAEAQHQSKETRSKADADAAQIVGDAKKRAELIRVDIDSEAAKARDEAAALVEAQRVAATAAAIDFERTLSERRAQALEGLEADVAQRHREANEATARLNAVLAEAQRTELDARERAEQIVRSAERRSSEIQLEAEARAEATRQNADRELQAALARRDSVNEQLAGVRRMLSAYGAPETTGLIGAADAAVIESAEGEAGAAADSSPETSSQPAE